MISWHFLFNSGVNISGGANRVLGQMQEQRVRWGHLLLAKLRTSVRLLAHHELLDEDHLVAAVTYRAVYE